MAKRKTKSKARRTALQRRSTNHRATKKRRPQPPSPAHHRGERQVRWALRIHTFGLPIDHLPRYGDLTHAGTRHPDPRNIERLRSGRLYNAFRGCILAAEHAARAGEITDCQVMLIRAQVMAAEMIRRSAEPGTYRVDVMETGLPDFDRSVVHCEAAQ